MKAILNYLNQKFGEQTICTVCNVADGIWSVMSIVTVPVLVTGVLYMAAQNPTVTSVGGYDGGPTIVVAQSTPAYLSSPVQLSSDVRKAAFKTYIRDVDGKVVYEYPEFVSEDTSQNVSFRLPKLPPGTYYVRSTITYQLNPIKNATLDVGVARVVVESLGFTE